MGNSKSKTKKFKQFLEKEVLESIYPSPEAQVIQTPSRRPINKAPQCAQIKVLHAQPIEEQEEAKVNAFDGRKQVLETSKWPNSVHGLVACKFQETTTWGTGILIGPNVVLTAGNNLYSHKLKAYADLQSLQFYPGMNGQALPFGETQVDQYFVSPNYIRDEEKEDYGILILKEPIGDLTGYFGLACLEPEELKKKKINVTGYPYDKVVQNSYEVWGMEGEASHVDKDKGHINYLMNTEAGQSGGGVWYQEGEEYFVCGIHVSENQFVNPATLLTRAVYQQIHTWLQQASSTEHLWKLKSKNVKLLTFHNHAINLECISLLMKYNLNELTTLNSVRNEIGNEGIKILAQNTSWINLSELQLWMNNIGAEGAKALAQNTSWINLSQLDLPFNYIGLSGSEGAKALAQNTSWIKLSRLNLSSNSIGAEGAKALAQNTSWIKLSHLDLSSNSIGSEGAKALAQNTSWINLSQLNLSSNNIGSEGAKALAQNTSWINLSQLNLSRNNIGSKGAKTLAQNTSWINLSLLNLLGNNIGAEGQMALKQNNTWKNRNVYIFA